MNKSTIALISCICLLATSTCVIARGDRLDRGGRDFRGAHQGERFNQQGGHFRDSNDVQRGMNRFQNGNNHINQGNTVYKGGVNNNTINTGNKDINNSGNKVINNSGNNYYYYNGKRYVTGAYYYGPGRNQNWCANNPAACVTWCNANSGKCTTDGTTYYIVSP